MTTNGKIKNTVSVGGIVRNAEGLMIVVQQEGGEWSLPKGKIEGEEQPEETVAREMKEETGLTAFMVLSSPLGAYTRWKMRDGGGDDRTERKTIIMYLCETDATSETPLRPEDPKNPEALWVTIDEAIKLLTHPADKAFLRRMKKRLM